MAKFDLPKAGTRQPCIPAGRPGALRRPGAVVAWVDTETRMGSHRAGDRRPLGT